MMEILKFYSYGILSNIICFLGLLGNTLTLYILNASKDMQKSTINIYLIVLTMYDNGVLIFSVLMLNIPAITDYQLQLNQQQSEIMVTTTSPFSENLTEFLIVDQNRLSEPSPNRLSSPSSLIEESVMFLHGDSETKTTTTTTTKLAEMPSFLPLSSPISLLSTTTSFRRHFHHHHLNHLLNNSLDNFVRSCFIDVTEVTNQPSSILHKAINKTSNEIKVKKKNNQTTTIINEMSQFDSLYCQLLFQLSSYTPFSSSAVNEEDSTMNSDHYLQSTDENPPILMVISNPGVQCESLLNETITVLDRFDHYQFMPNAFLLHKYLRLLQSSAAQLDQHDNHHAETYEHLCQLSSDSQCPPVFDYPLSPLVYYVKLVYPMALIAQTGSIWTTCLITIERYLAVCHPLMTMTLSTRTRAIWALSILSVMAFLFNLPRFAEVDTTCYQVRASEFRRNKIYYKVYYIFLNLSFNYILPLSLLSVLNIKIYASVCKANANRSELTRARQSELHLASMFIAIVAIFIACNAPAFIVNCLEPYFEVGTPILEMMTIFSNVLVCFNSSINFVIYCVFGRKFRLKFMRLLRLDRLRIFQHHAGGAGRQGFCEHTNLDNNLSRRDKGGRRGCTAEMELDWSKATAARGGQTTKLLYAITSFRSNNSVNSNQWTPAIDDENEMTIFHNNNNHHYYHLYNSSSLTNAMVDKNKPNMEKQRNNLIYDDNMDLENLTITTMPKIIQKMTKTTDMDENGNNNYCCCDTNNLCINNHTNVNVKKSNGSITVTTTTNGSSKDASDMKLNGPSLETLTKEQKEKNSHQMELENKEEMSPQNEDEGKNKTLFHNSEYLSFPFTSTISLEHACCRSALSISEFATESRTTIHKTAKMLVNYNISQLSNNNFAIKNENDNDDSREEKNEKNNLLMNNKFNYHQQSYPFYNKYLLQNNRNNNNIKNNPHINTYV